MGTVNVRAWQAADSGDRSTTSHRNTLADPPIGAYNITAAMVSDTVDLDVPIRGFETASAGDVKVLCADGRTVVFGSRAAGSRTSCLIKRIYLTDTTEALRTNGGGGYTPLIGLV